jgi:tetratricopeptide (TPR) repeat protein
MPTTVIAVREDRLGARLCALVNGLRIAEALDARFQFVWPPDDEWADEINDVGQVFSPAFLGRHLLSDPDYAKIGKHIEGRTQTAGEVYGVSIGDDDYYIVKTPFGEYPLERLPGAHAATDIASTFRSRIEFNAAILAPVERQLGGVLAGRRAIGLHLRRGDVLRARADYEGRFAPIAYFEDYVKSQSLGADAAVFVFSEDADAGRALVRRLDASPATLIDSDGLNLSPLQRAVHEFLVMTRMHTLAGTHSAFRETAALVGGAASVDIHDALSAGKRLELLRGCLKAMAANDPEYPITALCFVSEAEAAGDFAAALSAVDRLIAFDPEYWYYPFLKARIAMKQGRLAEAGEAVGHALTLDAGEPRLRHLHGTLLARQGRLDDAEAVLRAAIAANPNRIGGHLELSKLLQRLGRPAEAEAIIASALTVKPDNAKLHLQLAMLRLRRGSLGSAIAALRRALGTKRRR